MSPMETPHVNARHRRPAEATRGGPRWQAHVGRIALAVLMTSLFGCRATDGRLEELRALPEATLTYPGSEEVAEGGSAGGMTIDGPQVAFSWRLLGVDASDEEIEDFFAEELGSRGWVEGSGASGIRTTGELRARAWQKDAVLFRLAFRDPAHQADPAHVSRYRTIYDARLQERR